MLVTAVLVICFFCLYLFRQTDVELQDEEVKKRSMEQEKQSQISVKSAQVQDFLRAPPFLWGGRLFTLLVLAVV